MDLFFEQGLKKKLAEMNLFLVDCKMGGQKLLLSIDHKTDKITVEQCAQINRFLLGEFEEKNMDVEIEVSSPGLTNPFKVPEQYQKHQGRFIEILKKDGEKIDGMLMENGESYLILKRKINKKEAEEKILLDEIKKTNLKINF